MAKRKKRKSKKQQVQVPFPVLLANVLVLVAVLGLSYMWLCSRCDALGKEIKQRENELYSARMRVKSERDRWAYQTSPSKIRRAIKLHDLGMVMPSEDQIIRVRYERGPVKTAICSVDYSNRSIELN